MAVRRRPKALLIFLVFTGSLLIILAAVYLYMASPVDRNDTKTIEVDIPSGVGVSGIADILKENNLIRSEFLFNLTVRTKTGYLQASTYEFNRSMSMDEIIDILFQGNNYNPDVVSLTFKEGERITDYAEVVSKNTNHTSDEFLEVVNDPTYLSELINKYWFLTDSILQEGIYYPLEGYLAPDTYEFKNKDVSCEEIIEAMLDEMNKELSPYQESVGDNIYRYITMASMLELEGTNTENRKMIAGIFENRLGAGMNLGSDVTTYYALQYPMTSDLTVEQFATINPYNTRASNMGGVMPIGPICNPSLSSIEASISPTASDYYYFVADKNGNIFYTATLEEHEAKVQEIKDQGDWIW